MDLKAAAEDLVSQLTSDALPFVLDERELRVPGGLLQPVRVTRSVLAAGLWTVEWEVLLIGPAGGQLHALGSMGDMLAALPSALETSDWEAATYLNRNLSADPLPMLITTLLTESEA